MIVQCHFFSSTSIHPSIHPDPVAVPIFNMNMTPQQVLGHITAIETVVCNGLHFGNIKAVMKEQKVALVRVWQAVRMATALTFCRENCLPGKRRLAPKMFRMSSGPIVKVVLNLAAEKCRKSAEFLRPGTNGTRLQLIRSCAFLLDPGVPISKCQSVEVHWDFPMQRMCARVRSYFGISDARMIEIKARV